MGCLLSGARARRKLQQEEGDFRIKKASTLKDFKSDKDKDKDASLRNKNSEDYDFDDQFDTGRKFIKAEEKRSLGSFKEKNKDKDNENKKFRVVPVLKFTPNLKILDSEKEKKIEKNEKKSISISIQTEDTLLQHYMLQNYGFDMEQAKNRKQDQIKNNRDNNKLEEKKEEEESSSEKMEFFLKKKETATSSEFENLGYNENLSISNDSNESINLKESKVRFSHTSNPDLEKNEKFEKNPKNHKNAKNSPQPLSTLKREYGIKINPKQVSTRRIHTQESPQIPYNLTPDLKNNFNQKSQKSKNLEIAPFLDVEEGDQISEIPEFKKTKSDQSLSNGESSLTKNLNLNNDDNVGDQNTDTLETEEKTLKIFKNSKTPKNNIEGSKQFTTIKDTNKANIKAYSIYDEEKKRKNKKMKKSNFDEISISEYTPSELTRKQDSGQDTTYVKNHLDIADKLSGRDYEVESNLTEEQPFDIFQYQNRALFRRATLMAKSVLAIQNRFAIPK